MEFHFKEKFQKSFVFTVVCRLHCCDANVNYGLVEFAQKFAFSKAESKSTLLPFSRQILIFIAEIET